MDALHTLLTVFPAAVLSGVAVALMCSMLGVFVILKRMVFIGAVLSEVAALGLAAAMVLHLPPLAGATVTTLAAAVWISRPFEQGRIPRDAVLGAMFAVAGALSILLSAHTGLGLEEVKALLYGDLVLTRRSDLAAILGVVVPLSLLLFLSHRPILYTFLDRDAARLLGLRTGAWEVFFFSALALVISVAARAAGAMLVFAYLTMPASAALLLSRQLRRVMLLAAIFAVTPTLVGLHAAIAWDLPANQLIVALMALPLLSAGLVRGATALRRASRISDQG